MSQFKEGDWVAFKIEGQSIRKDWVATGLVLAPYSEEYLKDNPHLIKTIPVQIENFAIMDNFRPEDLFPVHEDMTEEQWKALEHLILSR